MPTYLFIPTDQDSSLVDIAVEWNNGRKNAGKDLYFIAAGFPINRPNIKFKLAKDLQLIRNSDKLYIILHGNKKARTIGTQDKTVNWTAAQFAEDLQTKFHLDLGHVDLRIWACNSGFSDGETKSFVEQLYEAMRSNYKSIRVSGYNGYTMPDYMKRGKTKTRGIFRKKNVEVKSKTVTTENPHTYRGIKALDYTPASQRRVTFGLS